jgi:hypothetical protein
LSFGITVHFDELLRVFDPKRSEGDDNIVAGAEDPDYTIFGFHTDGEIEVLINGFAQFDSDAVDSLDGMHCVQLPGYVACGRK